MRSYQWNGTSPAIGFVQEGNNVVRHVYLTVLTINPLEEYKYAIFPPNLNSSHGSWREHTHHLAEVRHKTFFELVLLLDSQSFFVPYFIKVVNGIC